MNDKHLTLEIPTHITWKYVLYPHAIIGHINKMQQLAKKLNYTYFAWNGIIYHTDMFRITNLTTDDIK